MNGLPYVAFYFGDFVAGVRVFTTEEVGAYILLLGYQWINGPLPDCQEDLDRIAGVTVTQRVRNKFQATEKGLVNLRLERERERGIEKKAKQVARVRKFRARLKGEARSVTVTDTLPKRFCYDSDSLLPLGKRDIQEPAKPKRLPKAARAKEYGPDIEAMVAAYPNVPSVKDAATAWANTTFKPVLETILAAIEENKRRNPQWLREGGKYIPGLSVWINQRRWEAKMPQAVQTRIDDDQLI